MGVPNCHPSSIATAAVKGDGVATAESSVSARIRARVAEGKMSVREIFQILKSSPNKESGLKLAARLHRAAREGRVAKDGRTLDARAVDEAMDAWLKALDRMEQISQHVERLQQEDPSSGPEEDAEMKTEEEEAMDCWENDSQADAPANHAADAMPAHESPSSSSEPDVAAEAAPSAAAGTEVAASSSTARVRKPSLRDRLLAMKESKQEKERAAEFVPPRVAVDAPAKPATEAAPSDFEEMFPGEIFTADNIEDAMRETARYRDRKSRTGPGDRAPQDLYDMIVSNKYNHVDRVWQAPTVHDLPRLPDNEKVPTEARWMRLPHIAINGRTNCGKSTLVNHCIKWDYAAKASSVAGRTKSIDFYCINDRFVLVDFPGYPDPDSVAHMSVADSWTRQWEKLVMGYLRMAKEGAYDLRLLLHLQMSKIKPCMTCQKFITSMQEMGLPHLLVMTKDDQLTRGHVDRKILSKAIRNSLKYEGPHLHYTSTTTVPFSRKGRKQLHRWIRTAVNASGPDEVRQTLQEMGEIVQRNMKEHEEEDRAERAERVAKRQQEAPWI